MYVADRIGHRHKSLAAYLFRDGVYRVPTVSAGDGDLEVRQARGEWSPLRLLLHTTHVSTTKHALLRFESSICVGYSDEGPGHRTYSIHLKFFSPNVVLLVQTPNLLTVAVFLRLLPHPLPTLEKAIRRRRREGRRRVRLPRFGRARRQVWTNTHR